MSGGIFLLNDDGQMIELREQAYINEDLLQKYLADHPNLLAGDLIDHDYPRRWLLVHREVAVPSGEDNRSLMSLDHLFLDQDAIPTLVEVKRSSDSRIRREVVGQMLDYAANAVVNWDIDEIRGRFAASCQARGRDPEEEIRACLGEGLGLDEFWKNAEENLSAGRIRLLFVADEIPVDLRRIVEFLNKQMNPAEVLAVEIKQYGTGGEKGLKTLVPRVYGQTVEIQEKRRKSNPWNEEMFFNELMNNTDELGLNAARAILEWARKTDMGIRFGKGSEIGSFTPYFYHNGIEHQLFAIYTMGKLETYFSTHAAKPGFEEPARRSEMLEKLNAIDGINIPPDAILRHPTIFLHVLDTPEKIRQFLDVYEWHIKVVKET